MHVSPSTSTSAGSPRNEFRFRARYALFAYGMVAIGVSFAVAPFVSNFAGDARTVSLVIGLGSASLALLYLLSPAWRMTIIVDDDGLEVLSRGDRRFHLAWSDVVRVVASVETKTCFVDGGDPSRSLKVPGKGAPAPYAIDGREALYDAIMAHVPADRVEEVIFLEAKAAEPAASPAAQDDDHEHPPTGE